MLRLHGVIIYRVADNFFLEHELKKALPDSLTRAAWLRLIDNGKLANQIARLAAIVVGKKPF